MEGISSNLFFSISNSSFWSHFLLNPIFLHGFSGSLHLVLLFVLFLSWVCNKFGTNGNEGRKLGLGNIRLSYYRRTLFCSLSFSLFNLTMFLFKKNYWSRNGWSEEKIVVVLDSVLQALSWLAISVYLHTQVSRSVVPKYPFVLRVWWYFFFSISFYCLVIDLVYIKKHQPVPVQLLFSDALNSITGLFFCFVGFFGKSQAAESALLQEPLISANSSSLSNEVSKKPNGGDTVSPYSSAGVFSLFTFSWLGPLVALGYKKPLDLDDVPQLATIDSVKGAFPILRENLEFNSGNTSGVTTLKLVKALIFTTWREILLTAFHTATYTLASYVGPYLIDTFVQYLNGRRNFKNEGYLLVSTFIIAKIIECLCLRHWFFKLQQIGMRTKAALIVLIYQKGLTLSCQAKQGHTSGEIINFMTVDAERVGEFSSYLHDPWMVIFQVVLALAILYKNLGLASVATLVATVLAMLLNIPLGKLQENFQTNLMKSKDQRMKAMSEVLRNMRILKLQGWEMKFLSKIVKLRYTESGWLKKYVYTNAVTTFIFLATPTLVAVVTFGTCMLIGIPLDSGKILSALAVILLKIYIT